GGPRPGDLPEPRRCVFHGGDLGTYWKFCFSPNFVSRSMFSQIHRSSSTSAGRPMCMARTRSKRNVSDDVLATSAKERYCSLAARYHMYATKGPPREANRNHSRSGTRVAKTMLHSTDDASVSQQQATRKSSCVLASSKAALALSSLATIHCRFDHTI